ncbi:MAG: FecR domain-containing protein [Bdellovibrio sp.]|nr:FecR domain-containing protein [Bdellovibrio sp.]
MFRIFLAFLFCACFWDDGYASNGTASILSFAGDVIQLNHEGVEQDVHVGGKIEVRHSLTTLANGRVVIRLADDSKLSLEPESELLFEDLIDKTSRGFQGASRLMLLKGGILADVTKKFQDHASLEINTDREISFWVKGTYFYTFIDPSTLHIWTLVKGGTVQAVDYQHDDHQLIAKGESMVALQGKYLTRSLTYDWAKKLEWKGAIENNFLYAKKVQTSDLRNTEVAKQVAQLRNRELKPFIDAISLKYNEEGREKEQFGEAILIEIPSIGRESESIDAFASTEPSLSPALTPTPTMTPEPVMQVSSPQVIAGNHEKRTLEIVRIRSTNVCRWAGVQGFLCKTAKQCSGNTPYMLGNVLDENERTKSAMEAVKVCLGCNIGILENECVIKPMKCATYSDVFLQSGVFVYRGTSAYRCIDLLPFNLSKLNE